MTMPPMTERDRLRERERILSIFEAHRAMPGAAFDESHFLDFLLANPQKRRAVYDSYEGLKRFNAFIDQLQLEYSIYLPKADREADHPLDRFVARVVELRDAPRASLTALENQATTVGWPAVALSNLVLVVPALMLWQYPAVQLVVAVPWVAVNLYWFWAHKRRQAYNEDVRQRLVAALAAQRKQADKHKYDGIE
jgi:hypothetical protein